MHRVQDSTKYFFFCFDFPHYLRSYYWMKHFCHLFRRYASHFPLQLTRGYRYIDVHRQIFVMSQEEGKNRNKVYKVVLTGGMCTLFLAFNVCKPEKSTWSQLTLSSSCVSLKHNIDADPVR